MWRRRVAVLVAVVLVAASCSDSGTADPTTTTQPGTTAGASTTTGTNGTGTNGTGTNGTGTNGTGTTTGTGASFVSSLRLSEGQAQSDPAAPTPVVDGTPIDEATVAALLDRLPEWAVGGDLAEPFAWPAQTMPPPITGVTVDQPFPATADAPEPPVETGPLHVLRHQPDGEVGVAPFISITFDRPMVPVTTLGQLDALDVPVVITPAVEGRWQWIGTRTLRFDVALGVDAGDLDRLPMATEYTVTVPAGTTSANGDELAEDETWTFSTPPAQVESVQPIDIDTLPLAPVFVTTFDQRVDPQAVLAVTTVTADGDAHAMRLATAAEIAGDPRASSVVNTWPDGRWVAFRPVDPFEPDVAVRIEIGPHVPSTEGPSTDDTVSTSNARTYAPLRVLGAQCDYGTGCPPTTSISVAFDNALDLDLFDPSTIRVEPALGGLQIGAYGSNISIRGNTLPDTTYTITIPAGLTDTYGQQLAENDERSITIGDAQPMLQQFPQALTTLDPLAPSPTISVTSTNHDQLRVRVFAVEPSDWDAYARYYVDRLQNNDVRDDAPPFDELLDTTIDTGTGTGTDPANASGATIETVIDLADEIAGHPGGVVVLVEPTGTYGQGSEQYWMNRPTMTWVQSTRIGVDVFADDQQLRAWVTDLTTGEPLSGASVQLAGQAASAVTDADGLATLQTVANGASAVIATLGDDTSMLPSPYDGFGAWSTGQRFDQALFYVIDDRQVYRPGETVSIKGWTRRLTTTTDAQVVLIADGADVNWIARDAQGNEVASGTAEVSPLGGFDFQFGVPAAANLGYAWIEMTLTGIAGLPVGSANHSYRIEEFRRPEFEVAARPESAGPAVVGAPLTVAVDADYYAGGPLAASPVDWQVTTSPATYAPPGWADFSFGRWTPWWYADARSYDYPATSYSDVGPCCSSGQSDVATFSGVTDADGTHYLQIDVPRLDGDLDEQPVTVTAQANVQDVNRQSIASSTSVLVHPSSLYVGLAGERTFVSEGEPLDIDVIVTDVDGAVAPGTAVHVTASRTETVYRDGQWVDDEVDAQTCDVTSAAEAVSCEFAMTTGGTWTIAADVTDAEGRGNHSELARWVTGGDAVPTRTVQEESLTVVPDRAEYAPGQSAQLLVLSPVAAGEGLAVVTRNGITSTIRFAVVDGSAIVSVPLAEADIPGVSIDIEVVGTSQRTADDGTPLPDAPARPAFATGRIALPISLASRTLDVDVAPAADTVEPGEDTAVDVTVTGPDGQPVAGAELAVVVVDEAVLALSGYQLQDPLSTFYAQLPTYLSNSYGRSTIVLGQPDLLGLTDDAGRSSDESASDSTDAPAATVAPTEMAGGAVPSPADWNESGGIDGASTPATSVPTGAPGVIEVRTNFDALAVFEPEVTTDADGHALVDVPLPENLTRYRVMVVAVAGDDTFGSNEANITARLPLMVRPSAPRFLNFGDVFELPVVVQNQTDAAMDVDVVLQASNLDITGPAGVHVSVPANDRIEVRFPVAAVAAGTATFRVAVASGDLADASTIELPVYTPSTSESFATYGVIDDGATSQPIVAPTDVIPEFGGLEVTTSSTSLQTLTDAVLYLTDYPYRSSDGLAARIIAIASLRNVLDAFDAAGLPTPDELNAAVQRDVDALLALQNGDGGFAYWQVGRESDPFNSVQATHALVIAQQQGFDVPAFGLQMAMQFVHDVESHFPTGFSEDDRTSVSAYALHVRSLAGDRDSSKAQALYDDHDGELPLDAIAWLWPVIDDTATSDVIERDLGNRAVDTAGAVTFTNGVDDDGYLVLRSDRRTDGLVLDALIAMRPDSDLVPKVVAGLLGSRNAGRWDSVQENSFILLALHRYFETYESQTPDFVAGVWLGAQFVGDHEFVGRSTDRSRISIPTAALIEAGDGDLVIGKAGTGRLYYRIGLRTAPTDLHLDPLDRGFVVMRTYEGVDDPADVTRTADGTWHIRAGARVRVRLTMIAESQRTHAALVDPLPAGLEILNPALATTAEVPDDPNASASDSWWWWTWFDHQNMRDDRAEAFATLLPAGTYDYSYVASATTPGTFVVPPTRAEEMYSPETFGRGSTDTVVIEG